MSKRVVILTSSQMRHDYFRKSLALCDGVEVVASYCEDGDLLRAMSEKKNDSHAAIELAHLDARDRSEEDFFGKFVALAPDLSKPTYVPRGAINEKETAQRIINLHPDLLIAYGCSIVRAPLILAFTGKFLNVHLGLSPYYRGAGTNFWPFVNGEPEYAGVTYMYLDAGVDTGEIIHQVRPRIFPGDNIHQIGNRLIGDMSTIYADIIRNFDNLEKLEQPPIPKDEKVYMKKHFSAEATEKMYLNFADGMIQEYLASKPERDSKVLILKNSALMKEA